MNEQINIILVDDHKIFRTGIKAMLRANDKYKVINEAASADELYSLLETQKADILLLDVGLPGKTGIEITEDVKNKYPQTKVLILSAEKNEYSVVQSVKSGAMGYLHKDSSEDELLLALNSVSKGEEYFGESVSPVVYKSFIQRFKKDAGSSSAINKDISEREMEVIKHFCDGLTYKEISDKLNISTRTVESHKVRIMKKLELNSIAGLVNLL